MKIVTTIIAILIALLSIGAGVAKIMLVPEETKFLAQFGFTDPLTIAFGIAQVAGGILLAAPTSRLYGAATTGIFFTASFSLILSTGNIAFAVVSLLPVLLSGLIIYQCAKAHTPIVDADA